MELESLGKGDEDTIEGFTYMTQRTVDLKDGEEIEVVLGKPPAGGVHATGRMLLGLDSLEGYMTWLPDGPDSMDRQKVATASAAKGFDTLLDTPGRYLVICIHGESRVEFVVDVPAGPEFVRDFVFPPLNLRGKISGPNGAPVVGARVDLTPRSGLNPRHPAANITYSHTSGADGGFSFPCIPPARYAIGVHAGGVGEGKEPVAAKAFRDIEVLAGSDPAPIEIVLGSGVVIQGSVRAHSGGNAYTDVFVIDGEGEPLNPLDGVQTKKDGTFQVFGLAPGTYKAIAANGEHWSELVAFTVPVRGELPTLDLELKPTAKLTIDIDGRQAAWIDLRDNSGVCFSALFDKHVFNRAVNRDWSSTSFVYRVPPGQYRVAVVGSPGRAAEQKIVARAGESLAIDL
ncbi:MAG TPA: carboxypeptidase-like regulatory domain-containing protein [Planctomycetota bacterium]|nr:carboxypeptidase-like regulatory domain-containing protein [Planctomycetota bacterium]